MSFCTFRLFFLVRKLVSIQAPTKRNEAEGRDEGGEAKE